MKLLFSNPKLVFKILLVLVAIMAVTVIAWANTNPVVTTHVSNTFADVNGDGALDLIVNGEVIFNMPPLVQP